MSPKSVTVLVTADGETRAYSVPEGTTAAEALKLKNGHIVKADAKIIVNGAPASCGTVLREGDTVSLPKSAAGA